MFPKWATQEVEKKSSTWNIPVEVGFKYLVRLHFSELGIKVAAAGELRFKILINDMIAQTNSDLLTARDGKYAPLYRDYVVMMRGLKTDGKRNILVSILSYDELRDGNEVLAGFEIVKLSNPDNSLACSNPVPRPQDSTSKSIRYLLSLLGKTNATATVAILLVCLINIIVYNLRNVWEASSTEEEFRPSDRAERQFRQFSLSEIQLATEDFHEGHLIGKGGFVKVCKGLIDKGRKTVAVKRLKSNSKQGAREFLTEIETLSELRHINLVSLIGYCRKSREMILVYEYMPNGTLADHLYKNARGNKNCSSLTWEQRLNICIETGRGLDYLHTGHRFIHRDVKASNILLDENFVAKVSDFGLAKPEDRNRMQSHVSTKVKGTFGYFDPYYMTTQKLTRKSDTYAFGVVLFEALCGRPAIDSRVSEDERVLTMWVRDKITKGEVDEIVDWSLRGEISPNSLLTFVEVAEKCLHDEPKNRPTMAQVVLHLESALEQQEGRNSVVPNEIAPVASDVGPSNDNINILSESADESTEVLTDMQTVTFPLIRQTDLNYSPAARRDIVKLKKFNPFRAWRAFWRRGIPSDRKEFGLATAFCEDDTNLWKLDLGRHFSLREMKIATNYFDENFVIGNGGFGKVYKGLIDDGATTVAIRRDRPYFNRANELVNELQILSKLRHRHLVSLIGYCDENREMILVYNYMAHGSLRLDYLHTGTEQVIIHGDFTSDKILLDEKWVAKLYDFRLLKVHRSHADDSRVSTLVNVSFDYLDPEGLTEKSDVYSFGVVLFEVLCARPVILRQLPPEQVNLVEWATSCFMKWKLEQIIDSNLKGQIAPECLNTFAETAVACLSDRGIDRPAMRDVIGSLESAMQLQEAASTDEGIMKFDASVIAAATNQFSSSHKIGEGGFASVYKAVLPTGRIIAVKRFSSSELALVNHYRNEAISVSSLHHQNIIKLLGYYIHEQRGILLYEFMENGSLDKFIFDELRRHQLQWSVRFKVIIGIAKGVIYLHQELRPRTIHRDLSPSNILLDNEMNPKISGFGLARNIEDGLSELSTIAADGYTSPECITQERISEKEDVYSFGVLVLEILSGKKNNGDGENLIEYAWKLWIEGIREVLNLVDRSLGRAFSEEEALLCIQVGLLCTQSVPHHRPTMPSVLKMLLGEELSLQEMAIEQCSTNTEADGAFNSENDRPESSILAYFPNISERRSQFQPECRQ
ncbi:hypothetical protein C2S51_013007 [Perilla frutescens var. frutescens]|nr:hypothetical protein C2S51_013007 [Perilla frutescens var. frutescens]